MECPKLRSQHAKDDAARLSRIIFVSKYDAFEECSICMMGVNGKSAKVTPCKHVFHSKCLRTWTDEKNKDTCPNCRSTLRNELTVVPPVDPMEMFVTAMMSRVMSTPSTYRLLPLPPFTLDNVLTHPTLFNIESHVGLHTDALSEIVNWITHFGVRITNINDVISHEEEGVVVRQIGQRRPGTMEILYTQDQTTSTTYHLFAVAIASPDSLSNGDCIAWHTTPHNANLPMASISVSEDQLHAALIQTACVLLACETNVVMELITSGSALNFGNPSELVHHHIDSIMDNINIDFGGVNLIARSQQYFYIPTQNSSDMANSDSEYGPDSP